MKAERGDEATEGKFESSRAWFTRLKERCYLHIVKVPGEAVGPALTSYPEDLAKIIKMLRVFSM